MNLTDVVQEFQKIIARTDPEAVAVLMLMIKHFAEDYPIKSNEATPEVSPKKLRVIVGGRR